MSDPIWEELTRSPLDPDPEFESPVLDWVIPVLLAAAFGLAIGFMVIGGEDNSATTTTPAAETTTTEAQELADPDPIVPDGYVDTAGVALRALALYSRHGNLYVIVNQTVRSDRNPLESAAFHASDWVLAGDGIEIEATRSIESTLAPGMQTVEFPGVTSLPVSEPRLLVRRSSPMVVRTGCQGCAATAVDEAGGEVTLEGVARPYSLPEPLLIEVTTGLILSLDTLDFTDEWGFAAWHVIDENDARVRVELQVAFEGTGDPDADETHPTLLVPVHLFGTSQQNPSPANPESFTRIGTQQLERAGELITADNQPTGLTLNWIVEWQYAEGEELSLPLAGVTDLGEID